MEPRSHRPMTPGQHTNRDPLLTIPDWAEYLGISENFARQLIKQRRVTRVTIGRKVLVPTSEALRVIAEGTQPATQALNPNRLEGPR